MARRRLVFILVMALVLVAVSFAPLQAKSDHGTAPVLVFVSDGMRQDLLDEQHRLSQATWHQVQFIADVLVEQVQQTGSPQ